MAPSKTLRICLPCISRFESNLRELAEKWFNMQCGSSVRMIRQNFGMHAP